MENPTRFPDRPPLRIAVLGSTGSIGTQTLDVVRAEPDRYEVVALLPLGHPRGRWGVAPRRPAESLTSWNRFGERRA